MVECFLHTEEVGGSNPSSPTIHPHELLLLRHGESLWNRERRMQGGLDSPLTERGEAEARAVGGLLGGLGVAPWSHRALASPQGRARATARLALGPLGLEARPDARLAEIGIGLWAGLTVAAIAARWPGPPGEPLLAFYARCPGGEGLEALASRAGALLRELRGPAVLVSHGITLRVISALALGLPPAAAEGLEVPQGALARLRGGRREVLAAPSVEGA